MKRKYEERIEMLTNDIVTLVEEDESAFAMAVKMKWRLRLDTERAIWAGGYSTPTRQQLKIKVLEQRLEPNVGRQGRP